MEAMKKTSPKNISTILTVLEKEYPNTETQLSHKTVFQLLVATMLSAQCTDKRVNQVTSSLFNKYRAVSDFAKIKQTTLEKKIRSTGFFRNKAKNIINSAKIIKEKYHGKVPDDMEKLVSLPGVARKTANIVLYHGYGITAGIAVDTHVKRLSIRLGLSTETEPVKIEKNLMEIIPQKKWGKFNGLLVLHGRQICKARKPMCYRCKLNYYCIYYNEGERGG
jgi:endonuclease-3